MPPAAVKAFRAAGQVGKPANNYTGAHAAAASTKEHRSSQAPEWPASAPERLANDRRCRCQVHSGDDAACKGRRVSTAWVSSLQYYQAAAGAARSTRPAAAQQALNRSPAAWMSAASGSAYLPIYSTSGPSSATAVGGGEEWWVSNNVSMQACSQRNPHSFCSTLEQPLTIAEQRSQLRPLAAGLIHAWASPLQQRSGTA